MTTRQPPADPNRQAWQKTAYWRAWVLLAERQSAHALAVLEEARRSDGRSTPLELLDDRTQRLHARLLIWSGQFDEGRNLLLRLAERLSSKNATLHEDTGGNRFLADLMIDINAIGHHEQAIAAGTRLYEASQTSRRRALRGTNLGSWHIDHGFAMECNGNAEGAATAYNKAIALITEALAYRSAQFAKDEKRWAAHYGSTLSQLVRAKTRQALMNRDPASLDEIIDQARTALKLMLLSDEAPPATVGLRVGRLGAAHLHRARLSHPDDPHALVENLERPVTALQWAWASMTTGYLWPMTALDYADALSLADRPVEARATYREALRRLEGQCGPEYPPCRVFRQRDADL